MLPGKVYNRIILNTVFSLTAHSIYFLQNMPQKTAKAVQKGTDLEFCNAFNARTKKDGGLIIPVVISIYQNRTFSFITKTPPAAILLKRAAGIAKASGEPNKTKIGKVTMDQVKDIAKTKMPDLNANDLDAAVQMVLGTARSMGIEVTA